MGNYFQASNLRLQTLGNFFPRHKINQIKSKSQTKLLFIILLDASFNRITKIGPNNIPDSVEMLYLNDNLISVGE